MLTLIIDVLIAGGAAYLSYNLAWWAPLIVFPVIMSFGFTQRVVPQPPTLGRNVVDLMIMAQQIAWIIVAAMLCYDYWQVWWGAVVGGVVGLIGCMFMAPRRWATESHYE
jgi:hypothetical protein